MRIAFVGKGGSGKTTLASLFSQFACQKTPVLAIDADLNMHMGPLLGIDTAGLPHLSDPSSERAIKERLRGDNARITDLSHFRKTTPPATGSNLIVAGDANDPVLARFSAGGPSLKLMVVGTYDADDIGASCYHNNLAILENVLSHTVDAKATVVTDMVAGVDAFANTLHAQFDMLVLAVEPTKRGLEVFDQYVALAEDAGVADALFVVGNKVRTQDDRSFIARRVPERSLIGFFPESDYLRKKDQEEGSLDVAALEAENGMLLETIRAKLAATSADPQGRLEKLYEIHRRYVAQDFVRRACGDLAGQIDPDFDLADLFRRYDK